MNDEKFLLNSLGLNLGIRANNKRVEHVKLPKWAESASDFLAKMRAALESPFVS